MLIISNKLVSDRWKPIKNIIFLDRRLNKNYLHQIGGNFLLRDWMLCSDISQWPNHQRSQPVISLFVENSKYTIAWWETDYQRVKVM